MSRTPSTAPAAHPAIESAAAREAAGDWADAIDILVAANRVDPAPEVEVALADLRHRAWIGFADQPDGTRVDPRPSPAIGPSGLPEGDFATITAGEIRGAVLDHGSLLMRDALRPEQVDELRTEIDVASQAALHPDTAPAATWRPLQIDRAVRGERGELRPLRRSFVSEAGGALLADAPHAMFVLHEILADLGLLGMVTEYLGARPVMSAHKSTLRRVPVDAVGGWHQDGAFLGAGVRAFNIWIALTDCGVDAPGLDILPCRLDHIVPTGTEGSYFEWAVSDRLVDELATTTPVVRPELRAGDMVIFDEMLLHRTAVDPAMTRDRHAVEFWCFSAGSYPEGQIPVVW